MNNPLQSSSKSLIKESTFVILNSFLHELIPQNATITPTIVARLASILKILFMLSISKLEIFENVPSKNLLPLEKYRK